MGDECKQKPAPVRRNESRACKSHAIATYGYYSSFGRMNAKKSLLPEMKKNRKQVMKGGATSRRSSLTVAVLLDGGKKKAVPNYVIGTAIGG